MSVRASASLPSSCSGAMYWNVPSRLPASVSGFACVGKVERPPAPSPAGSATLRQAEVEELRSRLRQHDVAGLEVAMDDARAVRLVERVGDLRADPQRLVERQGPFSSRSASVSPSRCSITR